MSNKKTFSLWISIVITIIVGLLYFITPEYRSLLIFVGTIIIIFLYLSDHTEQINELKTETKRLDEKLKIHEQLIDIKSRLNNIEKRLK